MLGKLERAVETRLAGRGREGRGKGDGEVTCGGGGRQQSCRGLRGRQVGPRGGGAGHMT